MYQYFIWWIRKGSMILGTTISYQTCLILRQFLLQIETILLLSFMEWIAPIIWLSRVRMKIRFQVNFRFFLRWYWSLLVSSSIKLNHLLLHVLILGILPAPNNVQYSEDPTGYLQILWEPPTLVSDSQNVRIDSRITHFITYITTDSEESTIVQVYNASGTSFAIGIDKIPCSFWFQVAAVNPAGVGERSPPQNLTLDCEFAR